MATASLSTGPIDPQSPIAEQSPSTTFDLVSHYNSLIKSDNNITPPIAAIESLISLLATTPLTTISETLALLSTQTKKLLLSQQNPIPLSAGADLLQRYLVSSFQQRPTSLSNSDFSALRNHIITNAALFVKRADEARLKIAQHALPFIRDDSTIVTFGYSRVVHTALTAAAETHNRFFNVVYVLPASSSPTSLPKPLSESIATLNGLSVPTTIIPLHALSYALASLPPSSPPPQFLIGAAAVLENGSIVTDLGTHQIGLVAKSVSIPLHVAVESYKFVRNFPLGYGPGDLARMGVRQDVLRFSTTSEENSKGGAAAGSLEDSRIEITPPELISALVTENGIMTPNAVSEELIKLWF